MMELPEAMTLATQLEQTVQGKTVAGVEVGHTPHKFAFFNKEAGEYAPLLAKKTAGKALAMGGFVRLAVGDAYLLLGDGVNVRYLVPEEKLPQKRQLVLAFGDGSHLVCSVQMYGGMWVFAQNEEYGNPYYHAAMEKPSPLEDAFDREYFARLLKGCKPKLSAKALLGTEQRIPGLGNGCLQDIFLFAGVHPKSTLEKLDGGDMDSLYAQVREKLAAMVKEGGRSTEKDLFGNPGGYPVALSAKAAARPCPVCGATIEKQAYLGGNIYFCPVCQPLKK